KSLASTGATRSGDWPVRWPPISSRPPDNFLACPPVRSIAAPPQPNEFLFLRTRYRPQSRPPRIRFFSSPAKQSGALSRVRLRHSTGHWLRNDAATGAYAAHPLGPTAPPWARRFCVRPEAVDPCSTILAARLDPGALRPAPGCRDKPQSVGVARPAPKKRRSCAQTISRKWNHVA